MTLTSVHLIGADGYDPNGLFDVDVHTTITSIREGGTGSSSGDSVDGGGRFLVPGLIDTHVHLGSTSALRTAVRAGLTTVIELGTHPDSLVADLRAIRDVPSILSAGSAASAPGSTQIARMGFPAESGVSGPEDTERYLDWRIEHGSDVIKIIIEDPAATDVPALSIPTIAALVTGAHRRGLLTIAHVVTAEAFVRGLDAGVDVLTHAPLDRPLPDETVQRMRDSGTVASPTLVMMRVMARARLGDRADAAFANALESVRRLHAGGVPIIAGTDANETLIAPVPLGPSLHEEIGLLQEAGLTAASAVLAATGAAASALRLDDRGRIAEGLRSDLLLVDRDPTIDPSSLATPTAVWVGGERAV